MAEAAIKRTPGRGRFISFEGGEGSGKSTQIKKLAERLEAAKLRTLITREPGGSPGAEIIRHLVLSGMGKLLGPDAETLLFAAARDDHVRTVIQPALTFILDVPVEVGLKRAAARRGSAAPDRFESEDLQFHQELREGYREIAAAEPERCVLIDATADANTVASTVWTILRERFSKASATSAVSPA